MKTKFVVIMSIILIITSMLSVYAESDSEKISVEAKVVENKGTEEVKQKNGITTKTQTTEVRILEGEYENEEYEMKYILSEGSEDVAANAELKEEDKIIVEIEEKEGEITNINYKETVSQEYILYITGAVLILLVIIIGKMRVIKPLILYLIIMVATGAMFIYSMQKGWNLILVSSVMSLLITMFVLIKANGINKKTIAMLICSLSGIAIAGILMYLSFNIIKLTEINIKMKESFINIKQLICGATILFSCGIANLIILFNSGIFSMREKPYKTKSDNIIEGQRSLKL